MASGARPRLADLPHRFHRAAEAVNVNITASRDCTWTAASDVAWMQLSATSGQGTATLGVTVAGNELGSARTGGIVVNNQRVTISQQARPCTYELRASPQNVGAAGGRGSVSIDTLGGCAWTATSSAGWLRVLTAAGSGPGSAEFDAGVNDGAARDATITIGGQTVTITQSAANQGGGGGGNLCSLTLAPSTVNAPAAGGTSSISIAGPPTCDWTATVAPSSASWLTVAPGGGRGSGSVAVTSARNTGSARTGTVTIGDQTATVNQAAAPACTATISPTSASFPAVGGDGSVHVTTQDGCDWTATGGTQWTQILTPRGTGSGDARYVVAANTTATPRSTTLSIGGQTHSVAQEAAAVQACTYTLQPTSQDHPFGGGPGNFSVTTQANCAWTASSGQGWATTTSSGTGNGAVSYTVQANSGGARQASITVSGGGGSQSHSVTQQAAPAPTCTYTLQPTSQDHPFGGGPGNFSVTTQANCAWTASSNQGWATTTSSGTGNGAVSYSVQANSGGARQASITVSGGGGSQSHSVTQQAAPAPTCTYTLQPTSQDHPFGGGPGNFSVTTQANCAWTAGSNQGWATTSSSGTGNGAVSYTVQANSGGARQATITVSGGGGSASHSVTQQAQPAPTCTYSAQPGSAQFPAGGGPGSFTVVTQQGCAWTASVSGASWISNVTAAGNGQASVSYTVQANTSGSQRQASITVNGTGGSTSHTVTQSP